MLIDSHAHLDFPEFAADVDRVVKRAKEAGVEKIVNIGADLDLSQEAIKIAEKYPNIWATVGVHAEYADDHNLENLKEKIEKLAKSSKKVVAIGECGPDYNWNAENRGKQLKLFQIQIEIAKKLGLPIICHIRNGKDDQAAEDAYKLLTEADIHLGVVHCFTLDKKWVRKFTDLGFYVGYTGIVTYKNANEVREAVRETPMDRLLVETDAPYLSPQSVRRERNEPAYVREVAEKIAEVKDISIEEVENITTANAITLFRLR